MTDRIMVYLGDDDRRGRLEQVAARVGAIGQRGPSISKMMQMIADGELIVEPEETMNDKAKNRVMDTAELRPYHDIILDDWHEGDEHLEWVATASVAEIVDWAQEIRDNERRARDAELN